jgi:hypothetical protein
MVDLFPRRRERFQDGWFPAIGMHRWNDCSHHHVSIQQSCADNRPSCWDGTVATDGDYSTHVAYPTDAPNGHICPSDYPKKFMTVQFETNFAVGPFGYDGNGTWVLANGDTTGVSHFIPDLAYISWGSMPTLSTAGNQEYKRKLSINVDT